MAFVVGGALVGGAVVWRAAYDDYSRYREHGNHRQYGDSALREAIKRKENEVRYKESDVETARRRMEDNFNSRVNQLKREKNYSGLNYVPSMMVSEVKDNMRRELDSELKHERDELAAIDAMIDKINELELQVKRDS